MLQPGKANHHPALFFFYFKLCPGFLRAPNTEVQCRQAGGVCSNHHCPPPHTRPFGRCQQGIPCCRTVVSPGGDGSQKKKIHRRVGRGFSRSYILPLLLRTPSTRSSCSNPALNIPRDILGIYYSFITDFCTSSLPFTSPAQTGKEQRLCTLRYRIS